MNTKHLNNIKEYKTSINGLLPLPLQILEFYRMKRITDYRKLFGIDKDTTLEELKIIYRNLMKEWHPDKFVNDDEKKQEAELKSQYIIEAYHFLVSLSPETHLKNQEDYAATINTSGIKDFEYKGQCLKIQFHNGSEYEYYGVPSSIYNKLINSNAPMRFAKRHIFEEFTFRQSSKVVEKESAAIRL
jgi:curved DNA-binding protein CbpA